MTQTSRTGDRIQSIGWTVRVLFGQKGDHPNVIFRVICFSLSKGTTPVYGNVLDNITVNVLLDPLNKDSTQVMMDRTFRPNQVGIGATGNDEFTFTKKFYISLKKRALRLREV